MVVREQSTRALRWEGGWVPAEVEPGAPDVADSWLVEEGRVRGLGHHWARFATELRALDGPDPARFAAAVEAALPRDGRWFPRVELRLDGGARLGLLLRPAPARLTTVRAWIADRPDPRQAPRRKGPDLERLGALRAEAVHHDAEEAVISDPEGRLLEGAYSSLLWWEDDALCVVDDDAAILPGVTRALLIEAAGDAGVEVRRSRPGPDALAGREAWLTSALHGIRAVTAWGPGGPPSGEAGRAAAWQARLEALARPLAAVTADPAG
jgi:branched-subunit amino acid aminotransferase/4-amino-4-deoxychorismate lyase